MMYTQQVLTSGSDNERQTLRKSKVTDKSDEVEGYVDTDKRTTHYGANGLPAGTTTSFGNGAK